MSNKKAVVRQMGCSNTDQSLIDVFCDKYILACYKTV